jgi:low affinity Fe/Cu permease
VLLGAGEHVAVAVAGELTSEVRAGEHGLLLLAATIRSTRALDRYASSPLASVLVIGAAAAWIVVSVAAGFPTRWEIIFQTLVAALTLVMVFVIQHTQVRHQRATQRKLDEILLAMSGADNALLTLQHASDDQLRDAGHQHRQVRQAALDDGTVPGAGHSEQVDPAQRPP